jgi:hypothetical protein
MNMLRTIGLVAAAGLLGVALSAQAPAPAPTGQQVEHRGEKNVEHGVRKEVRGHREVRAGKAAQARAARQEAKAGALAQEGKTGAAAKLEAKADRTEARGKAEVAQGERVKARGRRQVRKGVHQEAKGQAMENHGK